MKFRKKPVVIEAIQLTDQNGYEIIRWAHNGLPPEANSIFVRSFTVLSIRTLEGEMFAYPGDWIIKGVKGEFYPCKPDIFDATYEKVKDEVSAIVRDGNDSR